MPVNIQGKQYVTVAERVAAMHEARNGTTLEVHTWIAAENEDYVTMAATVRTPAGTFTGHARSDKSKGNIEGQSPLEVAETSAIGRALGFAGFGVIEGIATADEVKASQPAKRSVQQPAAYKGNWSKFWVLAKDKGMNKEEVHAYFGLAPEESLVTMAEMRAVEHKHSLQDEIDALTDMLRTVS